MNVFEGESFELTQLLTMSDSFTDPYDVRNELRMQLIVFNADLMQLNKQWDFSVVLRPLVEDTDTVFPLLTQIERLRKQKDRMTRLKDDFLRQEQERKEHEKSRPAPPPGRRLQKGAEVVQKDMALRPREFFLAVAN